MTTISIDFKSENQEMKDLFKQLFQLGIQLEQLIKQRHRFHNEVHDLIERIDILMEALKDNYES